MSNLSNKKSKEKPVRPGCVHEVVQDCIWLGDIHSCSSEVINKCDITHVICIIDKPNYPHKCSEEKIETLVLCFKDLPDVDISEYMRKSFDFIDKALIDGGRVLVHCKAGVSRSASVCINWVMKSFDMTYGEAFKLIQKSRKQIAPNEGFIKQLSE